MRGGAVGGSRGVAAVRPAPALDATGIAGVSLKALEAKVGSGPANLVLVAPVGVEVKAVSGATPQELRLSLRGINQKRAEELVADFRPTHPDVLGASVVSGDQRSSVIAVKLSRPLTTDPVVQAQASVALNYSGLDGLLNLFY
mgnify:CR=1 FL=1